MYLAKLKICFCKYLCSTNLYILLQYRYFRFSARLISTFGPILLIYYLFHFVSGCVLLLVCFQKVIINILCSQPDLKFSNFADIKLSQNAVCWRALTSPDIHKSSVLCTCVPETTPALTVCFSILT